MFRDYDDALIERQRAIYQDEAEMIASAQSAIQELESLFDSDMTTAKHELHKEKERLENWPMNPTRKQKNNPNKPSVETNI